jgi:two-component sensor histidine kinase
VAQYPPPDPGQEEEQGTIGNLADYQSRSRLLAEKSVQQMTASEGDRDPAEWARMRRSGVKSLLMIPMVFQDRVIGLFEMGSCQTERPFTEYEIPLAHLLANQAASAIENAKLYERAQTEIARRREAEKRIRDSLREKEVLLQEIHHRVKNNLQVVSSLLYLQSESVTDPKLLNVLQDSQNRVRSMALVHERLYRSEDIARIDFQQYIHDLASHLLSTYSVNSHRIRVLVDADDVVLDVNTAMPCGLIINELISNSLKHAFTNSSQPEAASVAARQAAGMNPDNTTDGRQDEICVELREEQEGQLMLLVGDNGVGLPESIDFRNSPSLGLLLVNSLVRQLRGTIELDRQRGTQFKIGFSVP